MTDRTRLVADLRLFARMNALASGLPRLTKFLDRIFSDAFDDDLIDVGRIRDEAIAYNVLCERDEDVSDGEDVPVEYSLWMEQIRALAHSGEAAKERTE